ncbi:MAG: hypothetical protein WC955_05050 [Elusimicrobiota bacterium]
MAKVSYYILDDSQLLFPEGPIDSLSEKLLTGREKGINFCIILHLLSHLSNKTIGSNTTIKIIAGGLEDSNDIREISNSMGLTPEECLEIKRMKGPSHLLIRFPWMKCFMAQFENSRAKYPKLEETERLQYMNPVFTKLKWKPQVTIDDIKQAVSENKTQNTTNDANVNTTTQKCVLPLQEEMLLRDCMLPEHMFHTKEERFKRYDITSGSKKAAISEKLTVTYPFILEHPVSGYGTLWEAKDEAYVHLNLPKKAIPGRGGFVSKFMAQQICKKINLNPKESIELKLGDKLIDVAYRNNDGKLIGYEIQTSEKHAETNAIKDLLQSNSLDVLEFVCETKSILAAIKRKIENCPQLRDVKHKISYSVFCKYF